MACDTCVGPVAGLQRQFLWFSSDSANIQATTANALVHGNERTEALAVSGGGNVLAGGQGSSILMGANGSDHGTDTFLVDDCSGSSP